MIMGPERRQRHERPAADAASYGADLVYTIEDPVLASYRTDPFTRGLTLLVEERQARDPAARRDDDGPRPGRGRWRRPWRPG